MKKVMRVVKGLVYTDEKHINMWRVIEFIGAGIALLMAVVLIGAFIVTTF